LKKEKKKKKNMGDFLPRGYQRHWAFQASPSGTTATAEATIGIGSLGNCDLQVISIEGVKP
jgi:hypothetical protein